MDDHLKTTLDNSAYGKVIKLHRIFAAIALIGMVLFYIYWIGFSIPKPWVIYVSIAIWVVLWLIPNIAMSKSGGDLEYRAFRSGIKGEKKAMAIFNKIPGFHVIHQAILPNSRSRTGTTEIDFVLVGANTVLVAEIKNNEGIITGNVYDHEWSVSNNGRSYTMRNPVRQAIIQKKILQSHLRKQLGIDVDVFPIVVFTNPNCHLMIQRSLNEDAAIYTQRDSIDLLEPELVSYDQSCDRLPASRSIIIDTIRKGMLKERIQR